MGNDQGFGLLQQFSFVPQNVRFCLEKFGALFEAKDCPHTAVLVSLLPNEVN